MQQFKISVPLSRLAVVFLIVACAEQPTAPAHEQPTPAAGKATDPFINSAYHFGFDLRWHGYVPFKVKREVRKAADTWADILRFNQLLPFYVEEYTNLQIEGLPSKIGGEWVYNHVIVYVSYKPTLEHDDKSVWGLGSPKIVREVNQNGLYYMVKPAVGSIQLSGEVPDEFLYTIALHELCHVMGLASVFLEDGDVPYTRFDNLRTRIGDRYFWKGSVAKSIYGITTHQWESNHVPMSKDGTHWDDSIDDLMAPISSELTTLTLGYLADVGYIVDDAGVKLFRRRSGSAKPVAEEPLKPSSEPSIRTSLRCGVSRDWLKEQEAVVLHQVD